MGELSKKVGQKIKQIREARKIKQYALAEQLMMEPSNLTRIESGYQLPKEENLIKIARALNVEIKDLFDFNKRNTKDYLKKRVINIIDNFDSKELDFIYNFLKLYETQKF